MIRLTILAVTVRPRALSRSTLFTQPNAVAMVGCWTDDDVETVLKPRYSAFSLWCYRCRWFDSVLVFPIYFISGLGQDCILQNTASFVAASTVFPSDERNPKYFHSCTFLHLVLLLNWNSLWILSIQYSDTLYLVGLQSDSYCHSQLHCCSTLHLQAGMSVEAWPLE